MKISELDLADVNDLLTELNGKPSKEKAVGPARAKLEAALTAKGLTLSTDDEGNFVMEAAKPAKTKAPAKGAKAAPPPPPEEDEEEEEEEEEEEDEEEEEEEEDEEEEEEVVAAPPPKKGAKTKTPPAPPAKPAKKSAKPAPVENDEDEEVEAEAPKAKRAPPPREPKYSADQRIKVLKKDNDFRPDSGRAKKWAIMLKSKTVGEFLAAANEAELATPSSYLGMCVKTGRVSVT